MKTKHFLETERLSLRFLNENDIDDLLLLFGDPVAMQYFPSIKSHSETREWLSTNFWPEHTGCGRVGSGKRNGPNGSARVESGGYGIISIATIL
jgi:hypothetical protein